MTKVVLRALLAWVLLVGFAWADFSSVRSSSSGTIASTTTPVATLPSPIEPGDLLLVDYAVDADRALTWDDVSHGTWSVQATETGNGVIGCYVYAKVADGTEDGGTLTLTLGTADTSKWTAYAIQDWEGSLAGGFEATFAAPSSTATPDPPILNPAAWDVEDTLWISMLCADNNTTVSVWPTGYTENQLSPNPGTSAVSIASATRTSTDASEDPAAFQISPARIALAGTLAVRGPSAVAGGLLLRRRRAD